MKRYYVATVLCLLVWAPGAVAQGTVESGNASAFDGLGTLWVLLAAFLVFFMQAGFGMVEAGLIRAKNAANILGTVPNAEEHHKFRGVDQEITLFQKVRIQIAVNDDSLDAIIEAINEGGRASGGAGKIFVTDLHDCVTVGTGARGPSEI